MSEASTQDFWLRRRAWLSVVAGALFFVAYWAWFAQVPRGEFEFGYAPFTPEPLPYSPMRGFTYEQLWGHVARFLLLGPALVFLTFGFAQLRPFTRRFDPKKLALAAGVFGVLVTAIVMLGVLRGRATVDDELVYRMQATFLGEGHLGSPEPGVIPPDVFSIRTHAGYTGKYLPGEPIVQVLGVALGMPPLLHLPLLALLFWAWFRAIELRAGPRLAAFSTIVLAVSPMVSLTAATGLSETTSLAAAVLLGLGLEWARGPRPLAGAVLGAVALGFGLATRMQSLLPIGGVLGPALAWALVRRRAWAALAAFVATSALGLAAIGAYNAALSGSPFTLPWYLQCAIEHYGFGRVWKYDLYEHTPWTALENLAVVLVRLNAWWLGLPCSLGVFALAALVRPRLARDRDWYAAALAIVAFEFLYYSPGGSDTGSLYHHELVLPGSLFAASVIDAALARFGSLAVTGFAVHFGLGTLAFFGEQGARLARLMETIHTDSGHALAEVKKPAIIFHETRGSELRIAGWVFDSFPERYRGRRDPVVTYPNLPHAFRSRVLAQYPGRHCYYYHRDPVTEAAELLPCAGNEALMDRLPWVADDDARPIWIEPTAYKLTSYHPTHANALRRARDAHGLAIVTCCSLRALAEYGAEVLPEARARCVKDGP